MLSLARLEPPLLIIILLLSLLQNVKPFLAVNILTAISRTFQVLKKIKHHSLLGMVVSYLLLVIDRIAISQLD